MIAKRRCSTRARISKPPGKPWTAPPAPSPAVDAYRIARDKWVETVLRDVAGWAESLSWGQVPGVQAQSPNRAVTVTAQAALIGPDGDVGALVSVVDPVDSLRQTPNDLWAATPDRPDGSAAAREQHSDRHRHRRPLVGAGVRASQRA